jgi:hypothetical protein
MRKSSEIVDLQADQAKIVGSLRMAGVAWSAIGFAVGTSAEAARQRWGKAERSPAHPGGSEQPPG